MTPRGVVRKLLARLGLLGLARGAFERIAPDLSFGAMEFPTFSAGIQRAD